MLRWFGDSLRFLYWLALLQLARLAVVLFCIIEVFGVLTLWPVGFFECRKHDSYSSCAAHRSDVLVAIQVALWQFTWLRLAQRGGKWRALAEWFSQASSAIPSVRTPHAWE